ncbi:MAG TPA: T9SS type A sorting domain-containing protein [Flavipsychrobacter sp.]|nr:T9SS type A sorting domain-containing protein [Flavipsychrobacter sp.]
MKRTFTSLALLLSAISLQAQITIDQSSYSNWSPGHDTLRSIQAPVSLSYGSNQMWDLSAANYANGFGTQSYASGTNAQFPLATFTVNAFYSFSGAAYDVNAWQGVTPNGLLRLGETIAHQNLSLTALTGGTNDSLVFPAQTVVYSSTDTVLPFPLTDGRTWTSTYRTATDFNASISMLFLNNAPGQRVSYFTSTDSVKGWGKMKVKMENGMGSTYMDVLQVKTHVQAIDSFYLNGVAVPNLQLQALGLSQGMESYSYYVRYYRAGEITPVVQMSFPDQSYTTPDEALVMTNRLSDPTGIEIITPGGISVYPNPVNNGVIYADLLDNPTGNWRYELANTLGQKVAAAPLNVKGTQAQIILNETATPGMYYLSLYQNDKKQTVKALMIK